MTPTLPAHNAEEITSSVMCQACLCLPRLSQGCEEQPEFLLGLPARQKFQHGQTQGSWRQNGRSGARRKTLPAPHRHQELWGVSKGFLWLLVLVYMAAGAPQEVPGAQAESGETCTPHARKHKIPSVGLGLRRLQAPHSVLGLPRHKAQVEPGTAGFLQSHWLCSGCTHTALEGRTGRCPVSIQHSQPGLQQRKSRAPGWARAQGMPSLSSNGKEQQAGPTRLRGLQHKASVWLQAQQLTELLHIFRAVLGLDHHHVPCTEPGDAGGAAKHSHRPEPQHGPPDQHPHQGRQIPSASNRQRELGHGQDPHSMDGDSQQGPRP